ncbi:MAG: hypothetical protein L6420_04810, partial [Elusimicrobia bacterium]|nr:hypothetical protein [Elusimicrobiota bacterium]
TEGIRTLNYSAKDNVDNTEVIKSTIIYVDGTEPITTAEVIGNRYQAVGGNTYINQKSSITLTTIDPIINDVASGVKYSEYRIDNGVFGAYSSEFDLSEGIRLIEYRGYDNVMNMELLKSAMVYVDDTEPVTSLTIGMPKYEIEGNVYISSWTFLSLAFEDPKVNEVMSGVKQTNYKFGSDAVNLYSNAFVAPVPDGEKALKYYSTDNVLNTEVEKTQTVLLDNTKPVTALGITAGKQYDGTSANTFYASLASRFSLNAMDPLVGNVASGVKWTAWNDNGGTLKNTTEEIALSEGIHELKYYSMDKVENEEIAKSTTILVDNIAPVTSFSISQPLYMKDSVRYITPSSELTFTAADPVISEVASGVNRVEVSIDGGQYVLYTKTLKFAEGIHVIKYRSTDNVENTEAEKTLKVYSDNTAPETSLSVEGANNGINGINYANANTEFILNANDPIVKEAASGLKATYYSIASPETSNPNPIIYISPFKLQSPDGIKRIEYFSTDNVNNKEEDKSIEFELDTILPEAQFICPSEIGGFCGIFKGTITLLGMVQDKNFKEYRLEYAEGKEGTLNFLNIMTSTKAPVNMELGKWQAPKEGYYTIKLKVIDFADNETEKQKIIYAGEPGLLISLGDKKMFKDPQGIAISENGDMYIADTGNDRVVVYTSTGGYKTEYGVEKEKHQDDDDDKKEKGHKEDKKEELKFKHPRGVALDDEGNIFIADSDNNRVVKLSPEGEELMILGCRKEGKDNKKHGEKYENRKSTGCFHQPRGMAINSSNEIYVADTNNSRVQKFSSEGEFIMSFSLPKTDKKEHKEKDDYDNEEKKGRGNQDEKGELGRPYGIALNNEGNIYITDGKGKRVLKYNGEGVLESEIGEDLKWKEPYGIAIDGKSQCLIVTDEKEGKIYKFNKKEELSLEYGSKKEKGHKEEKPGKLSGLALDKEGNLYIAQAGKDKILKYGMPSGETIIISSAKEKEKEDKKHKVSAYKTSAAGPDSTFKLGEVYVFPNPAIKSQKPTFHIEAGIADTVKIMIYTVSGRSAHEHTITGMPV